MKNLSSRSVSFAITILLLTGASAVVLSQISPVKPINITVNTDDHTTYGAVVPNTTIKPETRTETLDILFQNMTRQSYSNLTVRYCIFAQDVQNQKISVVLQHETPLALPTGASMIMSSQVASITYTPEHTVTTKQKAIKKGAETTKDTPVRASGKEFTGYGIQLLQTNLNLVVGQLFSSQDLTNQFKAAFNGTKKIP